MDIELASYVLHFRHVLFAIKLLHRCCSTSLCVLCRTCRQSSLYETLFYCKILSKHHHHHQILKGRKVRFVPGWDCHGLPIELKVLQSMKTKEREALTPIGIYMLIYINTNIVIFMYKSIYTYMNIYV
jgi:hypothetical protein